MVHCSYEAVIRLMITYVSLVRWPKVEANRQLSSREVATDEAADVARMRKGRYEEMVI